MQKTITRIIFMAALSCPAFATAHISNMVVFGDSLSDGGNLPESPKAFLNPNAPESVNNSVANFYVPFGNPVNTHGINPFNTPWPPSDDHYLAEQAGIDKKSGKREYRSISWPQYFLSIAKEKKRIDSAIISPSYLLSSRALPNTQSFNYAWGFATSSDGCVNPKYIAYDKCNKQSVLTARQNYFNDASEKNDNGLQIPGLIQQIKFFIDDYQTKKISVDQHTLYTVWIGGNDIISAEKALFQHHNPLPGLAYAFGSVSGNVLKSIEMLIRALPEHKRPKVVYVFNAFNPELTPLFYDTTKGKLGDHFVRISNFWLKWDVKLFNVFSDTKIVIVPTYTWFQTQSETHYFKKRMSEACQIIVGHYQKPDYAPPSNCDGFMFWNAVHLASPMSNMIGRLFFKMIYPE